MHCMLHRHNVASKTLPADLQSVITAVSFIHCRTFHGRPFRQLCEEMGAEYTHLVYHTENRWLSRGQVFNRALALHEQIAVFLTRTGLAVVSSEPNFIMKLAYISDIFRHLNALNVKLPGNRVTVVKAEQHVNAMKKNIKTWRKRVSGNSFSVFKKLRCFLRKSGNMLAL